MSPVSEPPGEIMPFGVSPVNYSDSDSGKLQWEPMRVWMGGPGIH